MANTLVPCCYGAVKQRGIDDRNFKFFNFWPSRFRRPRMPIYPYLVLGGKVPLLNLDGIRCERSVPSQFLRQVISVQWLRKPWRSLKDESEDSCLEDRHMTTPLILCNFCESMWNGNLLYRRVATSNLLLSHTQLQVIWKTTPTGTHSQTWCPKFVAQELGKEVYLIHCQCQRPTIWQQRSTR